MTSKSFERMMIDAFDEHVAGKKESVSIIREEASSSNMMKSMVECPRKNRPQDRVLPAYK